MPIVVAAVTKATMIQYLDPNTSFFGTGEIVAIEDIAGDLVRTIVGFTRPTLPAGSYVHLAHLHMNYYYKTLASPMTEVQVDVHKLSGTWVEAEATWNSKSTGVTWTTPGGDYGAPVGASLDFPPAYGWMAFDVTDIVKDAYSSSIDINILLKANDETKVDPTDGHIGLLRSRLASNPPILRIMYYDPAVDAQLAVPLRGRSAIASLRSIR